MMAQILYTLAALILLGILLVLLGLRGKRLNDHPVCRWCGFDLLGVYPAGVTCPECGAGLKRAKAVRIGARRKRWIAFGVGSLFIVAPVITFLLVGAALLSGSDVNTYKPVGMLVFEGKRAGAALSQGAAKELLDRVTNNKLSADQLKTTLAAALDIQADTKRPWCSEWGDIVETAYGQGKVSKDDYQRFLDQTTQLECTTRSDIAAGDPLPVLIKLKSTRVGSVTQCLAVVGLDEATVGAAPTGLYDPRASSSDRWGLLRATQPRVAMMLIAGPKSATGWTRADNVYRLMLAVPPATNTGPTQVVVTLQTAVQDWTVTRWNPMAPSETLVGKGKESTKTVHRFSVRVLRPGESDIQLTPASESTTAALRAFLQPRDAQVVSSPGAFPSDANRVMITTRFNVAGAPVPFAFDVLVRDANAERRIGQITSAETGVDMAEAKSSSDAYPHDGAEGWRTVSGSISEGVSGPIDLVLRPSIDAAKRTADLKEIYGGEIVIKGLRVNKGN